MTTSQVQQVGAWSKTLFGNKHMLELATAVSSQDEVRPRQVQAATGLAASSVHEILQTLVAVQLLKRVDRQPGDREQRYRRQEHPFWDAATALASQAQRSGRTPEQDLGSERMGHHVQDT
jgi:uncharacterized protein YceH (UPF0502 family)